MSKKEYLIETLGRKEIVHVLTNSAAGPSQAIADLQAKLGLQDVFPELVVATPLLDVLHVGRTACNKTILEHLLTNLLAEIPSLSQDKVLKLLTVSFRYITVYELRNVAFLLLESLGKIPEVFLRALAQPKLAPVFRDLSPSVKRQVWEISLDSFREEVEGVFGANGPVDSAEDAEPGGVNVKSDKAALDAKMRQLCSTVGSSSKLFAYICDWLAARIVNSGDVALSPQLRVFLLTLEETGHKIPLYGKLFELASSLHDSVTSRSLNLGVLVSTLRAIITSHQSRTLQVSGTLDAVAPSPSRASMRIVDSQRPSVKTGAPALTDNASLQDVLRSCLDILFDLDHSKTFTKPVTDKIAPGYFEVIAVPMDLSTMRSKVDKYPDFAEFERDIELICSNCNKYNGKGSYYGKIADNFLRGWRGKRVAVARRHPSLVPVLVPAKPERSAEVVAAPEQEPGAPTKQEKVHKEARRVSNTSDSIEAVRASRHSLAAAPRYAAGSGPPSRPLLLSVLESAWDALAALDPAGVFASPISDDIAPGYSGVVRRAMDLSTMQAKLHRYRTFADFEADARLLWDNCHSYNGPNSYYSKVALKMERAWRPYSNALRRQLGEEVEAEESSSVASPSAQDVEDEDKGGVSSSEDESEAADNSEHEEKGDRKSQVKKRKQNEIAPGELKSEPSDKKRSRVEHVTPKVEALKGSLVAREKSTPGPSDPTSCKPGSAQAPVVSELPSTDASMGLLWAIALFRDPAVQQLLQSRLARVLLKISSENLEKLPCDDSQIPILLQLIQLPAISSNVFPSPDPVCLRCLLPAMMAHQLLASPELGTGAPPCSAEFAAIIEKCPASYNGDAGSSVFDRRVLNGAMNVVFDHYVKLIGLGKNNVYL